MLASLVRLAFNLQIHTEESGLRSLREAPCRSVPLNAGRAIALTPSTARYRWARDPSLISHRYRQLAARLRQKRGFAFDFTQDHKIGRCSIFQLWFGGSLAAARLWLHGGLTAAQLRLGGDSAVARRLGTA